MLLVFRRIRCGAGSNGAKDHRARLARCCALSSRSQNYWKRCRLSQRNCDQVIITRWYLFVDVKEITKRFARRRTTEPRFYGGHQVQTHLHLEPEKIEKS